MSGLKSSVCGVCGGEDARGSGGRGQDPQLVGSWGAAALGALPWPRPCTRTAASLLLLARARAVTLRDSFIAACDTAPSLVQQSSPCFLSLFLWLADHQESGALVSAGHFCNNPAVAGAFSSALLPCSPTRLCCLLAAAGLQQVRKYKLDLCSHQLVFCQFSHSKNRNPDL